LDVLKINIVSHFIYYMHLFTESAAPSAPAGLLVSSDFSSSSCGSGPSASTAAPSLSGASKLGVKIRSSPPPPCCILNLFNIISGGLGSLG